MSFEIVSTSSFKKALKRYKYNKKALDDLKEVLLLLRDKNNLPVKYREHKLVGKREEYLECHVQPDLLLIYSRDQKQKKVHLLDLGSHSKIFG